MRLLALRSLQELKNILQNLGAFIQIAIRRHENALPMAAGSAFTLFQLPNPTLSARLGMLMSRRGLAFVSTTPKKATYAVSSSETKTFNRTSHR